MNVCARQATICGLALSLAWSNGAASASYVQDRVEGPSAHDVFSAPGIEGDRNLKHYATLKPVTSRPMSDGIGGRFCFPEREKARDFLRDCWRSKRRGYLVINSDDMIVAPQYNDWRYRLSTVHIFVEPIRRGKWQVVWILVNCDSQVVERLVFTSMTRRPIQLDPRSCGGRLKSYELDFSAAGEETRSL